MVDAPVQARNPPASHISSAAPGDGTLVSIADGEAKTPLPMITDIKRVNPSSVPRLRANEPGSEFWISDTEVGGIKGVSSVVKSRDSTVSAASRASLLVCPAIVKELDFGRILARTRSYGRETNYDAISTEIANIKICRDVDDASWNEAI